jgi:hypothetical protein
VLKMGMKMKINPEWLGLFCLVLRAVWDYSRAGDLIHARD